MIYAYYDKNGILREIINDSNNRQGSNNRLIYVYCENQDISDVSVIFEIGDIQSIQTFTDHIANEPIPYNREINYKYFKDNTPYKFYVLVISDTIMSYNGTCKATITLHDNENETHETQGLLTFNIQDEIVNDEQLFESQWQYLLDRLSVYEFFTKNGIIGRNDYIADYQNAPDTYKENQLVLTPSTRTSVYNPSRQIIGIKLFRVENGRFVPIYSSLDTTDMSYENQRIIAEQNLEITDIKHRLDSLVLDFSEFVKSSDLSQVAFTGNYNDLSNKPTIPTKLSDLPNDEDFITNAVNDLINYYKKSETLTTDEITARLNAIKTIKFEIYATLDDIAEPQTNVIYLIGSASPYDEYAYIENVGFELIGSSSIDLTNYVQSDNVLNTDNIVVGNGDKKVKDSGLKIVSDSLNNNGVPTTHLVQNAIREIHEITTISGDSGTITSTAISPYRLIIDENLVVYRRVSNDTNALTYHGVMLIDNTHFRDYFLKFNGNAYTRTYTENVSHTEFDELVENTPTDITYDSETKVAQLVHDGNPIGNGAIIDFDGFVPYFEDDALVLTEVGNPTFIDKTFLSVGLYLKRAIQNPKFLCSWSGMKQNGKYCMQSHNPKRMNKIVRYDMPTELNNTNFMATLHEVVKYLFTDEFADSTKLKDADFAPQFMFDPSANVVKNRSYNVVSRMGSDYKKSTAYILNNNGVGLDYSLNSRNYLDEYIAASCVHTYMKNRKFKDNKAMGVITLKLVENFEEVVVNEEKGTTKWTGNMAKNCIKLQFQMDITTGKLFVLYTFQVDQL